MNVAFKGKGRDDGAFNYTAWPRVVLVRNAGAASRGTACAGMASALWCFQRPTQDSAQAVASRLGELCAGTFTQAAMHTPVEISERAVKAFGDGRRLHVAIGGGSTTGLGKAIALRTDLPQIVVQPHMPARKLPPSLRNAGRAQDHASVARRYCGSPSSMMLI